MKKELKDLTQKFTVYGETGSPSEELAIIFALWDARKLAEDFDRLTNNKEEQAIVLGAVLHRLDRVSSYISKSNLMAKDIVKEFLKDLGTDSLGITEYLLDFLGLKVGDFRLNRVHEIALMLYSEDTQDKLSKIFTRYCVESRLEVSFEMLLYFIELTILGELLPAEIESRYMNPLSNGEIVMIDTSTFIHKNLNNSLQKALPRECLDKSTNSPSYKFNKAKDSDMESMMNSDGNNKMPLYTTKEGLALQSFYLFSSLAEDFSEEKKIADDELLIKLCMKYSGFIADARVRGLYSTTEFSFHRDLNIRLGDLKIREEFISKVFDEFMSESRFDFPGEVLESLSCLFPFIWIYSQNIGDIEKPKSIGHLESIVNRSKSLFQKISAKGLRGVDPENITIFDELRTPIIARLLNKYLFSFYPTVKVRSTIQPNVDEVMIRNIPTNLSYSTEEFMLSNRECYNIHLQGREFPRFSKEFLKECDLLSKDIFTYIPLNETNKERSKIVQETKSMFKNIHLKCLSGEVRILEEPCKNSDAISPGKGIFKFLSFRLVLNKRNYFIILYVNVTGKSWGIEYIKGEGFDLPFKRLNSRAECTEDMLKALVETEIIVKDKHKPFVSIDELSIVQSLLKGSSQIKNYTLRKYTAGNSEIPMVELFYQWSGKKRHVMLSERDSGWYNLVSLNIIDQEEITETVENTCGGRWKVSTPKERM